MAGDAFWEFERAGWERAADRYEECWTDTGLFVEPLLDAAGVRGGLRLLDVACGPGYVSEAAAARGAEPVGLDVAVAMVERARLRCPGLTFVAGDAQQLPLPDASFDWGTMNFGILHLSQPEAAPAEARRVLVPGGRLAFTAWVEDGNAVTEVVDGAVAAHAVPVQVPDGPAFYRFADADKAAARSPTPASRSTRSGRRRSPRCGARPPQTCSSRPSSMPVSVPQPCSGRSRPNGWTRSEPRWPTACDATRTATTLRCRPSRA